MTEPEDVNPFAAPKQPTISSDPTIGDPIPYEATPTIDDLNSALRSTSGIVAAAILLALLLFGVAGVLVALFQRGPESGTQLVLSLCIFFFSLLVALYLRFKLCAVGQTSPDGALTSKVTVKGFKSSLYIAIFPFAKFLGVIPSVLPRDRRASFQ